MSITKLLVFLWTDRMNLYDEKYGYSKKINILIWNSFAKYEISIHIFLFCNSLDIG